MEVATSVMVLPSLVLVPQYFCGTQCFYCLRTPLGLTLYFLLKQFMPCNHMEQLFINKITWSSCKKDF